MSNTRLASMRVQLEHALTSLLTPFVGDPEDAESVASAVVGRLENDIASLCEQALTQLKPVKATDFKTEMNGRELGDANVWYEFHYPGVVETKTTVSLGLSTLWSTMAQTPDVKKWSPKGLPPLSTKLAEILRNLIKVVASEQISGNALVYVGQWVPDDLQDEILIWMDRRGHFDRDVTSTDTETGEEMNEGYSPDIDWHVKWGQPTVSAQDQGTQVVLTLQIPLRLDISDVFLPGDREYKGI